MSPLPDADPDKRIYALLKTVDLENLTFADFQGVAEKVYAEQNAEDTLRRIVLVNLARLAVAGEWTGLTSAGGGGGGMFAPVKTDLDSTGTQYKRYQVTNQGNNSSVNMIWTWSEVNYMPFLSPESGNVSEIGIHVSSSGTSVNALVGVYTNDDDLNIPDSLIGYATISGGSTGDIFQTSLSATITLEADKRYWIGICRDAATSFNVYCVRQLYGLKISPLSSISTSTYTGYFLQSTSTATSLPSSVGGEDELRPNDSADLMPVVTLKF